MDTGGRPGQNPRNGPSFPLCQYYAEKNTTPLVGGRWQARFDEAGGADGYANSTKNMAATYAREANPHSS
jgi:hypothetical protein